MTWRPSTSRGRWILSGGGRPTQADSAGKSKGGNPTKNAAEERGSILADGTSEGEGTSCNKIYGAAGKKKGPDPVSSSKESITQVRCTREKKGNLPKEG